MSPDATPDGRAVEPDDGAVTPNGGAVTPNGDAAEPMSKFTAEQALARRRVAAAYRRLGHAFAAHELTTEQLDELDAVLRQWSERAEAQPMSQALRTGESRLPEMVPPPDGARIPTYDERPVSGLGAPHGLDVEVRRDGDEIVGTVVLGHAHQGAPGRSHGGFVAMLFDDLFGFVLNLVSTAGLTGELKVRYKAGTPIGVPLECRVRLDEESGRLLNMSGELVRADAPDEPLAIATAVFIKVDRALFDRDAAGVADRS